MTDCPHFYDGPDSDEAHLVLRIRQEGRRRVTAHADQRAPAPGHEDSREGALGLCAELLLEFQELREAATYGPREWKSMGRKEGVQNPN